MAVTFHRPRKHDRGHPAVLPTVTTRYDVSPKAAAEARDFTRSVLHSWNRDDLVDRAELIVSEFVTGSLSVGSAGTIRLHRSPDRIRIEVTADRADFDGNDHITLGSRVVDGMSLEWGVDYTWPHYRAIWSDLG